MTRWQKAGAVIGVLLGGATIAGAALRYFGTTVEPLPVRFADHVVREQAWHTAETERDSLALDRDEELHGHITRIEGEQGEMRRIAHVEQCMENSFEMLSAQRLVPFRCDSLGIVRRAGDVAPADRTPENPDEE